MQGCILAPALFMLGVLQEKNPSINVQAKTMDKTGIIEEQCKAASMHPLQKSEQFFPFLKNIIFDSP